MKKLLQIFIFVCIILLVSGCGKSNSTKQSSGSWAYDKMITLNGINYVVSPEKVTNIEKEINEVKHYSTDENDSNKDNFSNYFKVGTKLYSISNISIKDAIAVEVEKNKFYKANNEISLH